MVPKGPAERQSAAVCELSVDTGCPPGAVQERCLSSCGRPCPCLLRGGPGCRPGHHSLLLRFLVAPPDGILLWPAQNRSPAWNVLSLRGPPDVPQHSRSWKQGFLPPLPATYRKAPCQLCVLRAVPHPVTPQPLPHREGQFQCPQPLRDWLRVPTCGHVPTASGGTQTLSNQVASV